MRIRMFILVLASVILRSSEGSSFFAGAEILHLPSQDLRGSARITERVEFHPDQDQQL